jgi:hypothetical protein
VTGGMIQNVVWLNPCPGCSRSGLYLRDRRNRILGAGYFSMPHAEVCRSRAEECERLSRKAIDHHVKRQLELLVYDWREMVEQIERNNLFHQELTPAAL